MIVTKLTAANAKTKLIYLNTNSGYGATDGKSLCTEETPMNPISTYGKSKCNGELQVRLYNNYVSFRLATIFGPSMRIRRDLLVNNFIWRAYKDKVNVIFEPNVVRNYLYIDDLVNILYYLVIDDVWDELKNEVYNLGNDNMNMSKMDLALKINEFLPHKIIVGEGSDPDKRNYIVSSDKLYKKLPKGLIPKTIIDERRVKEMVDLYKIIDQPQYGNY
jgi:nucleoside-diphosphate-sugar epimerase